MTKINWVAFTFVLIVIILGWIAFALSNPPSSSPGKYDALATCLNDGGTKFYGAFWCSHCQNQKKEFGASAPLLPYVECSKLDTNMNDFCKNLGIKSYPTWIFPDGSKMEGEVSLKELAEKSSCPAPAERDK